MIDDVLQPRRAGPSTAAVRWVETITGAEAARIRRLPGSTSSVLHEVVVRPGVGPDRRVVLRRYVHELWRDDGGELVEREVAALAAARSAPVPAPELLAADPTGAATGAPSLLMTRMPGRPVLHGGPAWVAELGAVYERLATWCAPLELPRYSPWYPERPVPPAWSEHPRRWEEAIALVVGGEPPADGPDDQPIHRDLHPANILLSRGRAGAVVDWVNACIGPFASDLARGRANLAVLAGAEAADGLLAAAGEPGATYDPWWDLSVAVELLPDPTAFAALGALGARSDVASARQAIDALVDRALAGLR